MCSSKTWFNETQMIRVESIPILIVCAYIYIRKGCNKGIPVERHGIPVKRHRVDEITSVISNSGYPNVTETELLQSGGGREAKLSNRTKQTSVPTNHDRIDRRVYSWSSGLKPICRPTARPFGPAWHEVNQPRPGPARASCRAWADASVRGQTRHGTDKFGPDQVPQAGPSMGGPINIRPK
jgi:hypothetical protein